VPVLDRILEAVCAALLGATVLIAFIAVIFRYVIGASLSWSFEASLAMLTYLTFLGSYLAMRHNAHLKVEVFAARLPIPMQLAVFVLNQAVVLGIGGVMIWYGMRQVVDFFSQTTAVMQIPIGWLYIAIPLSGALMTLQALVELVTGVRRGLSGEPLYSAADAAASEI
jgi:TRAP-type transport system small permease protein